MCHDFITIVLESCASGVCIVCAPGSARLLKIFARSSLRDFIKSAIFLFDALFKRGRGFDRKFALAAVEETPSLLN
jgi:hypothetical protein